MENPISTMKVKSIAITYQLSSAFRTPTLALGGQQKSRFCLGWGNRAFLSREFGDLNFTDNFSDYRSSLENTCRELNFLPGTIACDLHPDYTLTRWADRFRFRRAPRAGVFAVQHHHAHIASVLAASGTPGPVIGISWDGTGYGDDGALWGGEFLIADTRKYTRAAHLEYILLPGGEKAIEEPWRMAVSYLYHFEGKDFLDRKLSFFHKLPDGRIRLLLAMIDKKINSPPTSSVGRLFDAVSALLGLTWINRFPSQAAIDLERAAGGDTARTYPFNLKRKGETYIISFKEMFLKILEDLNDKVPKSAIATGFHNTLIKMGVEVASRISQETGLKSVVLSGGVFQNQIISKGLNARLKTIGLNPVSASRVPVHDGAIALGQAVIANAMT